MKEKSLNFIEQIIEEDLRQGFDKDKLRFRFPPEPNGYLHIGHAASICLNFGLGQKYDAPVNLRFDDTNPNKEESKYVEAITKDIEWLGFKWNKICYASDYFETLYTWAVDFIKRGKAYVDKQTPEQIAEQKGTPTQPGIDSPYRDLSIEENLFLFEKMKRGILEEGACVLRAKIDMSHVNMHLRDPIMYRIIKKNHHRTGNDWCIYPMYDWAHGQSDYLEQISHSFCSLEFNPHRDLYNWYLAQITDSENNNTIMPKQREFARRDLSYTVMSKRKLSQLIEKGIVTGWDDPRMPTLSALRRRGYTPQSIINFSRIAGISKRDNVTDVALLEHCIKQDLNKTAPRVMAVLNPLKLIITNYPEEKIEWILAQNNPENKSDGAREIPFSKEIYIEREDFKQEADKFFFRLQLGGEARLKHAYIVKANKVIKDEKGNITQVLCTYDSLSKSGSKTPESQRKIKGTLHWVCAKNSIAAEVRLYDRLFLDQAPDKHKDKNFMEFVNDNSLQIKKAFVEYSLKHAKPQDKFQFQRKGYFCVDIESSKEHLIFNKTVALTDTWAKKQNKTNLKNTNPRNESFERISSLCGKFLKSSNPEEKKYIKQQVCILAQNISFELLEEAMKIAQSNKEILRILLLLQSNLYDKKQAAKFLEKCLKSKNRTILREYENTMI